MQGKTCVVTGANTGLGFECARNLLLLGARVIIVCRSEEKAQAAVKKLQQLTENDDCLYEICDFLSLPDVESLAQRLNDRIQSLSLLVLNHGVGKLFKPFFDTSSVVEGTMFTNFLSQKLLVDAMLPLLQRSKPSRVVFVSSLMHRFLSSTELLTGSLVRLPIRPEASGRLPAELRVPQIFVNEQSGQAYQASKFLQVLYANHLQKTLKDTGVTFTTCHPGAVATDIWRHFPSLFQRACHLIMLTPEKGALSLVAASTCPPPDSDFAPYFTPGFEHFMAKVVSNYRQLNTLIF